MNRIDIKMTQQLRVLWSKTLDIPLKEINIDDDFLALGGDSVDALLMLSELPILVGCAVALELFYQSPTIKQLTEIIQLSLGTIRSNTTKGAMEEGEL